MVLTDEEQIDKYPVASLEPSKSVTEKTFYDIKDAQVVDKSEATGITNYVNDNGIGNNPTDAAFSATNSTKLYKLNSNTAKIGLGITLKVMAGDKIDVMGKSYYFQNNPASGYNNNLPLLDLLSAFLNAPAAAATTGIHGTVLAGTINTTAGTAGITSMMTEQNNQSNASSLKPKAFINVIFFDEQFKAIDYRVSIVGDNSIIKEHYIDLQNLLVPKNGFVYIYCSNETPVNVFFDNMQVVHTRGAILSEDHFYPFGLVMAGISSKAAGKLENRYKFNGGTELNNDFDIGIYETAFRSYDPQIGRFLQIDALADFNYDFSTYAFANDNPISMNDPFGLDANAVGRRKHKERSTKNKPKTLAEVVVVVHKTPVTPATKIPEASKESTGAKVVDIVTDFIPLVSGAKDIYKGIRDGNGWQVLLGVGSIALDFFTLGGSSIVKGAAKTAIKEGVELIAKQEVKDLTGVIVKKETFNFLLNEAINITEDRFMHVIQAHYPRSGMYLFKSKFSVSAREMVDLIKRSAQIPKVLQSKGNYQRIVDAGRNIGIDATTGHPTSIFTIITNQAGDLITSFPGRPGR